MKKLALFLMFLPFSAAAFDLDADHRYCEREIRAATDTSGETFTVTEWTIGRIDNDTATRAIIWMDRDRDGREFRADCILHDGRDIPVIWMWAEGSREMHRIFLGPVQQKKPETIQPTDQANDQENFGLTSRVWGR